jgi:hypothetical protein
MGGSDEPSNLIKVNTAMHAFLHKLLWEEHGSQYDYIAWKCLSGQITNEEANIMATKVANTGRKLSEEHNNALQTAAQQSNKERLEKRTHNFLYSTFQKKTQRKRLEEKTHNFLDSNKQRELVMRQVNSGNHMSVKKRTCPHCNVTTNLGNYGRWHGDKCKKRGAFLPL